VKKGADQIQFGVKPSFSKKPKPGKLGADFSEGLDDLDDDGKLKKKEKKSNNENLTAADGGKAFVNLGSAARGPRENKEEEKVESRPVPVKPTFRGKLNLKDTGA